MLTEETLIKQRQNSLSYRRWRIRKESERPTNSCLTFSTPHYFFRGHIWSAHFIHHCHKEMQHAYENENTDTWLNKGKAHYSQCNISCINLRCTWKGKGWYLTCTDSSQRLFFDFSCDPYEACFCLHFINTEIWHKEVNCPRKRKSQHFYPGVWLLSPRSSDVLYER